MDRRLDPRSIVTPYAFSVHPDLLGRPLATPWQRLGAILVDLVIIGFISQIGLAPLAIGSAALLFWLAFRKPGKEVFGKVFRIACTRHEYREEEEAQPEAHGPDAAVQEINSFQADILIVFLESAAVRSNLRQDPGVS